MSQLQPAETLLARAMLHGQREDWAGCRRLLEQAAEQPQFRRSAQFLLWEACQALHDPAAAVAHLRAAVRENPLTSRPCPGAKRRVLAIAVVGDFQANLPIEPLLNPATTELHTLWLETDVPFLHRDPQRLPDVDCVFIVIAEDARHAETLRAADALARTLNVPIINRADRIAAASRRDASSALQGLPYAIVPGQRLVSADELLVADPDFPIVIRPRFSHAGNNLARIEDREALRHYVETTHGVEGFYIAPFIDYRSPDGLWRKYRIIFVDGIPWPFHLAIHDDWAVWYYNAGMADDPAKRAEEARFLRDISATFPPTAMAALAVIAERIGLDYFGLDCALMPDGRLLLFEIETGMIVHDRDSPELYPYKQRYVPRIFRAVELMIDNRIARRFIGR